MLFDQPKPSEQHYGSYSVPDMHHSGSQPGLCLDQYYNTRAAMFAPYTWQHDPAWSTGSSSVECSPNYNMLPTVPTNYNMFTAPIEHQPYTSTGNCDQTLVMAPMDTTNTEHNFNYTPSTYPITAQPDTDQAYTTATTIVDPFAM